MKESFTAVSHSSYSIVFLCSLQVFWACRQLHYVGGTLEVIMMTADDLASNCCRVICHHLEHSVVNIASHKSHYTTQILRSGHETSTFIEISGGWPGTGEFPAQMASNAENVSIWWRHHVLSMMWAAWAFSITSLKVTSIMGMAWIIPASYCTEYNHRPPFTLVTVTERHI